MTFINGFEKGELDYVLAVDDPTRIYKAKFEKNEDDNFVLRFTAENEDFNAEYFFKRPAILRAPGKIDIVLMNFDAVSFSQTLCPPCEISVIYKSFSTEIDTSLWANSKHCAYLRYNKNDFRYSNLSLCFDLTTRKDQRSSWRNAFAIKVSSNNEILVSFEESLPGEDAYCVFRSQKPMDYELFEKYVNAVKTAIGLLGGYCFGDRMYGISAYIKNLPKNKIPLVIRYVNTSKALHHEYPLLDSHHYNDLNEDKLKLSTNQFNKFIKLIVENEDYHRALRLLTTASAIEGPSRGAIAAVALESIANELVEKGPRSMIVKDKTVASQLKYESEKFLKKMKPHLSKDEYCKIESKIGGLNHQPNAVKLESCFEKLGIKLSEEELFCISCRNTFLHGGLPKNKDLQFLTKDELVFVVSHRLIMLSAMLVLKLADYNGLVNDWGYTVIVKRRTIREGNPILHSGNAHREME